MNTSHENFSQFYFVTLEGITIKDEKHNHLE